MRIEASCENFVEYDSVEQLKQVLARMQGKWLHIGSGSNLLFLRPHYNGTILHSGIRGIEIAGEDTDTITLRVGAGEDWDSFVGHCVKHGYHGLENLSFIPGEVGASAVQNVGAYGVEACDRIEWVETIDAITCTPRRFSTAECRYAYRSSTFKHELRNRYVVTHVGYKLSRTFTPILSHEAVVRQLQADGITPEQATAAAVRQSIIAVRRAKLPDPKEVGSAGSFFMNPVVAPEKAETLLEAHPSMPHYAVAEGVKIPAAWLIEQCGWKGKTLGRAGVHPRQALVLINVDHATGEDIARLATAIREDVSRRFGIDIRPEVLYVE